MPALRDREEGFPGVRIEARSDGTFELLLYGDVGPEIAAKEIAEQIASASGPITVRINSYGGDLADGIAIYNALRRHADVTVVIDGVAASAASVIAMAGARIEMAENATLMIHGPRTVSMGDSGAMRDAADSLDRMAEAMARIYASRPRVSYEKAIEWLRDGSDHWFSASEALAIGLVDAVVEASREAARFLQPVKEWLEMVKRKQQPEAATQAADDRLEEGHAAASGAVADETHSAGDRSMKKAGRPRIEAGAGERPANVVEVDFLRRRNEEIETIARPFAHRDGVVRLEREYLRDPTRSVEDFRRDLLAELARGQEPIATAPVFDGRSAPSTSAHVVVDEAEKLRSGFIASVARRYGATDALRAAGVPDEELDPGELGAMSLLDMARELLERSGLRTRGMAADELVRKAARVRGIVASGTQTTSDMPVLLGDLAQKLVVSGWNSVPVTHTRFVRQGTVTNFQPHHRIVDAFLPSLEPVSEAGVVPYKAVPDGEKETITAKLYGERLGLSYQMVVNDDLGTFQDLARRLGQAARRKEEQEVYALLNSNPTMRDGNPLFDASHGNMGTAAAPSVSSFEEARTLMASQQDPAGADYLDLRPSVWVGPIGKLGDAQVVNDAAYDPDTPNKLQRPNKVRGLFADLIGSPRLSGTAWYAFADPAIAPAIEIAFLSGRDGPQVEERDAWETVGFEWRVTHVFAVGAIDWRGAVKNPGA